LPPLTTVSGTQFENKAMTMHNFSKLKQNVKSKRKGKENEFNKIFFKNKLKKCC
jgi:hypothetical protein